MQLQLNNLSTLTESVLPERTKKTFARYMYSIKQYSEMLHYFTSNM